MAQRKKLKKTAPAKKKAASKPVAKRPAKIVKKSQVKKASSAKKVEAVKKPAFLGKEAKKPLIVVRKTMVPKGEKKAAPSSKPSFPKKFLEVQHKKLVELKDHILDQMQGVAKDSLRSKEGAASSSAFGMHQADAGSDAYEKDFALSLLSQEQDALYEIEEAIKRIENGSYGVCEMSGAPIPVARLEAIPFARYTVACQAQFERENRSKGRWETNPQFMDSTENFFEEEEAEEDEEKSKSKE
ncbi:MAG: TraR/DksA C4-type zinc finger protein [bacterium]